MTAHEIKTVCFVGSGTMGCYNSLIAALAGYQVVLYDVSAQNLAATNLKYSQLAHGDVFVAAYGCTRCI